MPLRRLAANTRAAHMRVGIVLSRFNPEIGELLLKGAVRALQDASAREAAVVVVAVPGAWESALQGLYQWLLGRPPPPAIRAHLAESSGFDRCDTAFFDGLWQGVTGEFDALVASLVPYLDRVPEQLSPIEKCVLVIGAW